MRFLRALPANTWTTGPHGSAAPHRQFTTGTAPPDPADRLVHEPGFQVQCDLWFPHEPLPVGEGQHDTPPVLVMTSAFSGFIQARMLPSRATPDLLGGMWMLLQDAQAAPSRLLWDNESGIGRRRPTQPVAA